MGSRTGAGEYKTGLNLTAKGENIRMTEANNLLELLEAGMRLETHACGPCVGDDNFPDGEPGLSVARDLGPCVGDDGGEPPV